MTALERSAPFTAVLELSDPTTALSTRNDAFLPVIEKQVPLTKEANTLHSPSGYQLTLLQLRKLVLKKKKKGSKMIKDKEMRSQTRSE